MGADVLWRLTISQSTPLASRNIRYSPKTPSWARGPRFEPTWPTCERRQMPRQKGPWEFWSEPAPSNTAAAGGGGGSWGAAKTPGDGRLWQWPSGEFIKDHGLFCGRCLSWDMNVIRAQLKGQSCSMKCHWTLRGSNVPFSERLTDAPSSILTHQRSQQVCAILCCPVAVQSEENTFRFENIDLKAYRSYLLCEYVLQSMLPSVASFVRLLIW